MPLPEVREEEPFVLDRGLVNFLSRARQAGRTPLLATDGGCLVQAGLTLWQRAAWAVAAYDQGDTFVIQGQVTGVEQTPAAAERMAILRAAQHLSASPRGGGWHSRRHRGGLDSIPRQAIPPGHWRLDPGLRRALAKADEACACAQAGNPNVGLAGPFAECNWQPP